MALPPQKLLNRMMQHAREEYPEEACGVVLTRTADGVQAYRPIVNSAVDKYNSFQISATEWTKAMNVGTINYVFHSHNHREQAAFSNYDYDSMKAAGVSWIIVTVDTGEWVELSPTAPPPLLGREWSWGVTDCAALVRDAVKEMGIPFTDYPRGALMNGDKFVWDVKGWVSPLENAVTSNGFLKLRQNATLQKYDVILMSYGNRWGYINHMGVMYEPARNIFYHHLFNRLSEKAIWGNPWDKHTTGIYRHNSLPQ